MNAHIVPMPARGSDLWQDEIPNRLMSSLDAFDFDKTKAYAALADLAEKVAIDGYSLDVESAVVEGENWTVPGTVFIKLTYDIASDDPVNLDDAYPIEVSFHLDDGQVRIDSVIADTSSFYI